nr:hypothetical protein [Tanacetum cinerariifolium]
MSDAHPQLHTRLSTLILSHEDTTKRSYVADSDPDEDPEEDPEDDHDNYPADGGDGDDDDDADTDDEDEDPFEDEEEEDHLALANSSVALEADELTPTPRSPHTIIPLS